MARRRSAEETRRAEIAEAALRLILKFGFHSTTLDQVAAEAGVSKGLVSYYFSKKEELFLAVLERMVDRLSQDLERCYVTDGIRAGEFAEVDAKETASLVVACMEGLILQWLFSDDEMDLDGAYRICESLADRLLEDSRSGRGDATRVVEIK